MHMREQDPHGPSQGDPEEVEHDHGRKNSWVVALYGTQDRGRVAVERLLDESVPRSEISLLTPKEQLGRHFVIRTGSKIPEGAAWGGAVGGLLCVLIAGASIAAEISIPGVGYAQPLLITLFAAFGAGGLVGAIVGSAFGARYAKHEVTVCAGTAKDGGALVGVRTHDPARAQAVRAILVQERPLQLSTRTS